MRDHGTPKDPTIAEALGHVRAAVERVEPEARRIVVACSGGADSVAALGLLLALRSSLALEITVGHVDHGLRRESADEARKVSALANQLGLAVRVTRIALAPGPGLPMRARVARREALVAQARELGATTIVLAHTATDQAETMLMHMVRGAGLDGLAAMPVHEHPWLRPLLELTRAQTRDLAEKLGFGFVDDPSNEDPQQHHRCEDAGLDEGQADACQPECRTSSEHGDKQRWTLPSAICGLQRGPNTDGEHGKQVVGPQERVSQPGGKPGQLVAGMGEGGARQ